MENRTLYRDVVVIGGGLAGLAAAAYVARSGLSVAVLERSLRFGGRASTDRRGDYALNRGAHALYRSGECRSVLDELQVEISGHAPPSAGWAMKEDRLSRLPVGALSLMATGLFGLRAKVELGRFLSTLRTSSTDGLDSISVRTWLTRILVNEESIELVEALVRLTCFVDRPEEFSAGTAARQLVKSLDGVLYVDDGWQSMVDGLAAAARRLGASLSADTSVESIDRSPDGHFVVRTADSCVHGDAVILATGPREASKMLGPTLSAIVNPPEMEPVRACTLDVGLDRLPDPSRTFVVGIDQPVYLSVHSRVARLAPAGGALIHLLKYLPASPTDPREDRAELEGFLDRMQPGWRAVLCESQFLPVIKVGERLDMAADGGANGRPDTAVREAPGLFLAGDWVRGGSWLSDAALASARRAAAEAIQRARSRRAAA